MRISCEPMRNSCVPRMINYVSRTINYVSRTSNCKHNNVFLPRQGDGVDHVDVSGQTLLHKAADKGDLEAVTRLVWYEGANANLCDFWNCTPLHLAVENGHEVVCATLLEAQGVNVNAKDYDEWTPLHYASREGKAEVVRLLLEKGADATLRDKQGQTPLDLSMIQEIRLMMSSS